MATGKYVKDSNSALDTEDAETMNDAGDENGVNDGPASPDDNGVSSSVTKPKAKRAKTVENEDDEGLIGAFKSVGYTLAKAIEKADATDNDVPEDLWDNLNSLLGFEAIHISCYYAHLVANPHIARAFNKLPLEHKLNCVVIFVNEKFLG